MKLLLHTCCAPCLVYPLSELRKESVSVDLFFYNPNIHPYYEHIRRKEQLVRFAEQNALNVVQPFDEEELKESEHAVLERRWNSYPEAQRCDRCYRTRLERTAEYASMNGYDAFSTTLLGSIYQNHARIVEIGNEMAERFGVAFYYRDYRTGFREGQQSARDQGIYRQKYCGCICSLNNSPIRDKILASMPMP
jgi:epoxyqueuosine reductase